MSWQDRMDEAEQAWLDGDISYAEACEIAEEMEQS